MTTESDKQRAGRHLRKALLIGAVSGAMRAVLGWILDHCLN
jgi:hypothetical protein